MRIAVVGGTGRQGFGIALRLAAAGHEVTIGSRARARAEEAAARIREEVQSATVVRGARNDEAVRDAELVVVAVPHAAQAEIYAQIAPAISPGTIVVDTTNPIAPEVKAQPGGIRSPQEQSAAERAAEFLPPGVRLVAGFQNVAASHLRDLSKPLEGDVILCGDDEDAKRTVGRLVDDLPNLRWIDGGELSMARAVERLTGLLISVNRRYGIKGAGVRLHGHPSWGEAPSR
jgi:hypothetical protein